MPKITIATIATTVISGRLIAKSEMIMACRLTASAAYPVSCVRAVSAVALTFTGVFSEMPRAAPSRIVSPGCTPLRISTVSVAASRMPELDFRLRAPRRS